MHCFLEARKADEDWHAIILQSPQNPKTNWETGEPEEGLEFLEAYEGRDYNLFGILAGVRGDRDDELTRENRGLPHDVTNEVRAEYNRFGEDDNTYWGATWYSRAEFDSMLKIISARLKVKKIEIMSRCKWDKEYSVSEAMQDIEDSEEWYNYWSFKRFTDSIYAYAEIVYDADFLYHDGRVILWFDC